MAGRKSIDWDDIADGYNYRYKTNLTTTEMLQILYDDLEAAHKMERVLGPAFSTILAEMRRRGIKIKEKGHRWPGNTLKEIMCLNCRDMTAQEIANKTHRTKYYICVLLRKYGIKHKQNTNRDEGGR